MTQETQGMSDKAPDGAERYVPEVAFKCPYCGLECTASAKSMMATHVLPQCQGFIDAPLDVLVRDARLKASN